MGAVGPGGGRTEAPRGGARARLWTWVGLALLAALAASRVAAVTTTSINWDEFALFANAGRTAETGVLHKGGRPGLGVLMLTPFAADCADEVQVIRRARLLWLGITAAYLAGVALLVAGLQGDRSRRPGDAALALALLAAVPAFLEWSIQVRTDQLALAAGVWGGVALLASRRRPLLAIAAGLLFGVGFLATQKLVYVAALMALLAAGDLGLVRQLRPRRELARVALCAATAGAVYVAFDWAVHTRFSERALTEPPSAKLTLSHGLSVFEFYRRTLGFSQYREMLPTLAPHAILAALLGVASARAWRERSDALGRIAIAWAALALGLAVALFHAGRFHYFWMTLGLYPAVAFAVAREPLARTLGELEPRGRALAVATLAGILAVPALFQIGWMFGDTQGVQARSLALVHRNFAPTDAGFHPESALFCRREPDPFPTYFSQTLYRLFGGAEREENTERLLRSFEEKPVKFLVTSWRMGQFPPEVRDWWREHYQPYRDSLWVAGRRIDGKRGARSHFDLIVPGVYRWLPTHAATPIAIDETEVPAGHLIQLDRGRHTAELIEDVPDGMLVLALADPPGDAGRAFYKRY